MEASRYISIRWVWQEKVPTCSAAQRLEYLLRDVTLRESSACH